MNIHIEELKRKANALPETPGIYLMKDAHGSIVYVGKAKSLKARVVSYFRKNQQHTSKTIRMVHNITDFDTIGVDTELDALLLECQLIQKLHPMYNRQMNHATNYAYLDPSHHTFQPQAARTPNAVGPFRRVKQLPLLAELLSETYQLQCINPVTRLRVEAQLPLVKALSESEKWHEINQFFAGKETGFFDLCQQRLSYLTDHLLFEEAQKLHQWCKAARSFYQEVCKINTFWHSPELLVTAPLLSKEGSDKQLIKCYQIQFGQIVHSKICRGVDRFQPINYESKPRLMTNADLDPVCILIHFQGDTHMREAFRQENS
ncbi:GIY-YIG nuclease family protein [Enterococcus sp.]|uniref:GIY-YIG nuclease family protein n=1 Tax=Enterococcus sp. TaxID=35783 RepID=UPI0028962D24|nr:GIY-YIG nuclease family protein [Enterococcus sp.]